MHFNYLFFLIKNDPQTNLDFSTLKKTIGFHFYKKCLFYHRKIVSFFKKKSLYIILNLMKQLSICTIFYQNPQFCEPIKKSRLLTSFLCFVILNRSSFKHSLIHRLCFNLLKHYSRMSYSAIKYFSFPWWIFLLTNKINISKPYLMQHFCTISKLYYSFLKSHLTN